MNSQSIHGRTGGAPFNRDREHDVEERHRTMHKNEEMRRDHERERECERERERESIDRYHPAAPHQSSTGSIPIHQPVASRISGAIHSPGGLLANHNGGTAATHMGASTGPIAAGFGGSLQTEPVRHLNHAGKPGTGPQHPVFAPMPHSQTSQTAPPAAQAGAVAAYGGPQQPHQPQAPQPQPQLPAKKTSQQQAQQPQQHQKEGQRGGKQNGPPLGVTPGGHQIPGSITQGQQPILNDALTYLDQVKVQFHEQPDVYNRFLDIMKDFKSQAIDTPGVINRVSELFSGHPNLIQGFNTFLPPGYRIECGAGNDPNTIRVTTPMGTTVQSIAGRGAQIDAHGAPGTAQVPFSDRGSQWQQRPQPGVESPEAAFSAPTPNGASLFVQAAAQSAPFDGVFSQRPVPQMPGNLGSSGTLGARGVQTPVPRASSSGLNGNQANMERRGPVEFNHAISYVNKIKNRFQDKPEIYKQFLEILQTYQREQKPIQNVYAQVTTLFNSAPDLLEDFKQFLPESAGQAKAVQSRLDDGALPGLSHTPQPGTRDGHKMPPLGSFAPPTSASKDKKRPRIDKHTQNAEGMLSETATNRQQQGSVNGHKRPKLAHARGAPDTSAPIESTLTPLMPEPYPQRGSTLSCQEQVAFFERVKQFLSNRSSMNEFLKLCNLFSQNIIDRSTLFHKGALFICSNPELMSFWKSFVGYDCHDIMIDNRPAPPTEKLSLSNCRGYGPSYRLLPKRECPKPCTGRDELCNSVLNDQWASHPTWASEDSGFVAHRKNQFEEGLHRIEEERHDYDFNIEINLKCIQLLEPIAQQMLAMSPAEREVFHMPAALAGQSTSIFKRICKKLYGDRGVDVVNDMFSHPFDVVPVLLTRMKQKDEEWRFSQREWEKVWHAQTEHMYLKSLDHMGILVKSNDKRNLTAKHLVDVIKTKYEAQRRERSLKGKAPRFQLVWDFGDKDVIVDLLRLMMLYPLHGGQHSAQEKERLLDFFETFVTGFFDLSEELVQDRLPRMPPDSAEDEMEESAPAELASGRSKRNGKKGDLLRGVLDPGRNGSKPRSQKEDSAASGSKETTPDVGSANEEEIVDAPDEVMTTEMSNERWLPAVPKPVFVDGDTTLLDSDSELKADGFFRLPWYNFFANQTIFVFFSIFQTVYSRLVEVKKSKDIVCKEIERLNRPKPARDVGFADTVMKFFETDENPDKFWPKTMELIEDFITGELEETRYQEVLRHYYLRSGWKLYTIQDQLKSLCRLALTCSSNDSKEKTSDLINQYFNSREREETSYQTEISARKYAEKCVKDGDMFIISWFPDKAEATVRWLQRDDTTFYMDEMKMRERWQYYISSFIRVEPTEGIPRKKLQRVVLARNMPAGDESDGDSMPKPLLYSENLTTSICLKSSKMVWAPGTSEYFVYEEFFEADQARDKRREKYRAARASTMMHKLVTKAPWVRDEGEKAQLLARRFQRWMDEGLGPAAEDDDGDTE